MTRLLVAILLLVPSMLYCQTGSIRGEVTDARTGEYLVGANIIVVGSKPGFGAATDVNGMFLIRKLPPGEYVLRASYVDYVTNTIQNVKIAAGQTIEVSFKMLVEVEAESGAEQDDERPPVPKDTTIQQSAGAVQH